MGSCCERASLASSKRHVMLWKQVSACSSVSAPGASATYLSPISPLVLIEAIVSEGRCTSCLTLRRTMAAYFQETARVRRGELQCRMPWLSCS